PWSRHAAATSLTDRRPARGGTVYEDITFTIEDPVAIVTLNRPQKLNAFTTRTLRELRDAVEHAAADPAVVRIVITGARRVFCSGLDAEQLGATTTRGSSSQPETTDEVPGLFTWLLEIDKPVIAALNGVAAGGGFVLAVLCDVRIASTEASLTAMFSK